MKQTSTIREHPTEPGRAIELSQGATQFDQTAKEGEDEVHGINGCTCGGVGIAWVHQGAGGRTTDPEAQRRWRTAFTSWEWRGEGLNGGEEDWRKQLLCVLETPDLSRNRRRGEGQPADAGGDPDLTDGSVAAWRGSMITPGDWLSCCGGGVVRRGGGLLPGGTLRLLDRGCGGGPEESNKRRGRIEEEPPT